MSEVSTDLIPLFHKQEILNYLGIKLLCKSKITSHLMDIRNSETVSLETLHSSPRANRSRMYFRRDMSLFDWV